MIIDTKRKTFVMWKFIHKIIIYHEQGQRSKEPEKGTS